MTCHRMHQDIDDRRSRADWADDQLKPEMRGNQACLSCHGEYRDEGKLAAHTHHLPASQGSLCYNCHMPNTAYGLLKATRSHQISSPTLAETLHAGRPNACNLCHLDQTLHWTAEKLADWYGRTPPEPGDEGARIALSVEMALAGDAGQRALVAWHMGWGAAREAAGEDWLAPYLAILLDDDYPAVRFIAQRSLREIGGFEDIFYDPEMPPSERLEASRRVTQRWQENGAVFDEPQLLISPQGDLEQVRIRETLQRRNQTVISLEE
jgi:hypothetical protein